MSAVFNFTFVPWFRSVAPYIHKFRNQTFVIGLPGEGIAAGKLHNIAQDLALIQAMGVRIVLVHGFRPQVNEQLAAKGHAAKYSHGIRITDSVALDCAQEAAGQLRYEIEAAFSQGLPNTPMAGSTVRPTSGQREVRRTWRQAGSKCRVSTRPRAIVKNSAPMAHAATTHAAANSRCSHGVRAVACITKGTGIRNMPSAMAPTKRRIGTEMCSA